MSALEAEILAASRPLRVPGVGERRVLSRESISRLAGAAREPLWSIEARALQADVVPLHYLRNLARFSTEGQVALLNSHTALVGPVALLEHTAELLALNGVGRITRLWPAEAHEAGTFSPDFRHAVSNRNPSCAAEERAIVLGQGDPAGSLRGLNAVAACLEDSAEEQLLQFACRMAGVPLVLGGVEGLRGQLTTILPGDAGVALLYKPSHPHLEPRRRRAESLREVALMVASRLAEQVTHALLGTGDLLRGRLLWADLQSGELGEYDL